MLHLVLLCVSYSVVLCGPFCHGAPCTMYATFFFEYLFNLDSQHSQPTTQFQMSQIVATFNSRLDEAEQTHPLPISTEFYSHLDYVIRGDKYVISDG